MRAISILKWVVLLCILTTTIISCSKDDDLIPDEPKKEEKNNNEDKDQNNEGSEGELTLYEITESKLKKLKDYTVTGKHLELQKDTKKHYEMWDLVLKIVPPKYREMMSEFLIFAGEESGTAGFVVETNSDLSKWKMGLAIDFAYEGGFNSGGEFAYTIIHEFGHILTLNKSQIDASISKEDCQTYFTGEGCARSNSYIYKLYKNFWADIYSEFEKASDNEEAQDKFYEKYKDRFVTKYASTNPGEDIAEVFATFITQDNKPEGKTIAEKKILLLYEHDELVELRNFIRNNTKSRTKSRRLMLPEPGSWKQANKIGDPTKSHNIRR